MLTRINQQAFLPIDKLIAGLLLLNRAKMFPYYLFPANKEIFIVIERLKISVGYILYFSYLH